MSNRVATSVRKLAGVKASFWSKIFSMPRRQHGKTSVASTVKLCLWQSVSSSPYPVLKVVQISGVGRLSLCTGCKVWEFLNQNNIIESLISQYPSCTMRHDRLFTFLYVHCLPCGGSFRCGGGGYLPLLCSLFRDLY